jgi:hypothetical protein
MTTGIISWIIFTQIGERVFILDYSDKTGSLFRRPFTNIKNLGINIEAIADWSTADKSAIYESIDNITEHKSTINSITIRGRDYVVISMSFEEASEILKFTEKFLDTYIPESTILSVFIPVDSVNGIVERYISDALEKNQLSFFDFTKLVGIKNLLILFLLVATVDITINPELGKQIRETIQKIIIQ